MHKKKVELLYILSIEIGIEKDIIPFSTVVDREKARRCPFYAPSGFLYEIGNVVWAIYPEIFLNFLFRTLGR